MYVSTHKSNYCHKYAKEAPYYCYLTQNQPRSSAFSSLALSFLTMNCPNRVTSKPS